MDEQMNPVSEPDNAVQEAPQAEGTLPAAAETEAGQASPEQQPDNRKKKGKPAKKRPLWLEILSWILTFVVAVAIALPIRALVFEFVRVDGHSMDDTLADGEVMLVTKYEYASTWLCLPWQSNADKEASVKWTTGGNPQRFDVVICRYPGRGDTNFVKRVVGLPGDTVELRAGFLYVNGERYDEPYINDLYRLSGTARSISSPLSASMGVVMVDAQGHGTLVAAEGDELSQDENGGLIVNGQTVELPEGGSMYAGTLANYGPVTVQEGQFFVMGDHRNNSNDSRSVGAIDRSCIIGHVRRVVLPFGSWRGIE